MRKYFNLLMIVVLLITQIPFHVPSVAAQAAAGVNIDGHQGENGYYYGPVKVTFTNATEYSMDGGKTWNSYNDPLELSPGSAYAINYRASESEGTGGSVTLKVKADDSAPITTAEILGNQTESGYYNGETKIRLTSEDAYSGVEKIEYSYDKGLNWNTYSEPFPVTKESGTLIYYRAIDVLGNKEKDRKIKVMIDSEASDAPSILTDPMGWTKDSITVTVVDGADDSSGVRKTEYKINNGSWQTYTGPFVVSQEEQIVYARSVDYAGNMSEESSAEIQVDQTAPVAPVVDMAEDWLAEPTTIAIQRYIEQNEPEKLRYEYSVGNETNWAEYFAPFSYWSEGETPFFFRSFDQAGNYSPVVQKYSRYDATPPKPPTEIKHTILRHNRVDLVWSGASDNIGVAGYNIYDLQGTLLTETTKPSISMVGLKPNTVFVFKFRSYDAAGNESEESKPYIFETPSRPDFTIGDNFFVLLKPDGSVWTWGKNEYGQLGNGTTLSNKRPRKINMISDVTFIKTSRKFTIAGKKDGTVWAWGGAPVNSPTPILIENLSASDKFFIRDEQIFAQKEDGAVWAWGNDVKLDSDGNFEQPQLVPSLYGATDISLGAFHSLALINGKVYTWGDNHIVRFSSTPVSTNLNAEGDFTAIAAASSYSLALTGSTYDPQTEKGYHAAIKSWGYNYGGQLGDPTVKTSTGEGQSTFVANNEKNTVFSYVSLLRVDKIFALEGVGFASVDGGKMYSWGGGRGSSLIGRVIDKKNWRNDYDVAARMENFNHVVELIAAPASEPEYVLAKKDDDTLWSWGKNNYGQLGIGETTEQFTPQIVMSRVDAVHANKHVATVVTKDEEYWYWGTVDNPDSITDDTPFESRPIQLQFDGDEFLDVIPPTAPSSLKIKDRTASTMQLEWTASKDNFEVSEYLIYMNKELIGSSTTNEFLVQDLEAGKDYSFYVVAVDESGNVSTQSNEIALTWDGFEVPVSHTNAMLASGLDFSILLNQSGQVFAWGNGDNGSLGTWNGGKEPEANYVPIKGLANVTASYEKIRAVNKDGTVWSWGDGTHEPRQLYWNVNDAVYAVGEPDSHSGYVITQEGDLHFWANDLDKRNIWEISEAKFNSISVGRFATLAVKQDGTVWSIKNESASQVKSLQSIVGAAVGADHALVLRRDGTVLSWGDNSSGQLGTGSKTSSDVPSVVPGLSHVVAIAAGDGFSLALTAEGKVWTWGDGEDGKLGTGTLSSSSVPQRIERLDNIVTISAGYAHANALAKDGTVWSWGLNRSGQLGDGTYNNSAVPVKLKFKENMAPVANITYPTGSELQPTLQTNSTPRIEWGQTDDSSWTVFSAFQVQALNKLGEVIYDSGEIEQESKYKDSSFNITEKLPMEQAIQVRVRVNDGLLWSAWSEGKWLKVLKPNEVSVSYPSGTQDAPTITTNREPSIEWTQIVSESSKVTAFQVSIADSAGKVISDSGTVSQTTTDSKGKWKSNKVLPFNVPLKVMVRVQDENGWMSAWSQPTWIVVQEQAQVSLTYPDGLSTSPTIMTLSQPTVTWKQTSTNKFEYFQVQFMDEADGVVADSGEIQTERTGAENQWTVDKELPRNTKLKVKVRAKDQNGWSEWSTPSWMEIRDNMDVQLTYPSGSQEAPSSVLSPLPSIEWTQKALVTGTVFSHYQVQVMNEAGEIVVDSGEVASNSTTATNRWTVSKALPVGQKLQVQVRVKDGHTWSAWSEAKWLEVNGIAKIKAVIDGEENHTVYAKADGSVWTWGYNGNGQLGNGTLISQTGAVQVPGMSEVVEVATGGKHTLALKSDGTVWGWGHKDNNQAGSPPAKSPIQLAKEVVDIEAYGDTNYITKQDGTLWISKINNAQSLEKKNGIDGIVQVSAGGYGVFALKSDGSVWDMSYSPPKQISGVEGIVAVASGYNYAIALKSDGTVWGWGNNGYYQLGDGTPTTRSTPIQIPGLSGIIEISSGRYHNLALKSDGTVWGWGYNYYGQLGLGSTTSMSKAVQVPGISRGVAISAGQYYSEVVEENGTVWSFGRNDYGQLGNGTVTDSSVPVEMKENTAPVVSLNYPMGAQASPSVAKVTQPSVEWRQTDAQASTVFSQYQVQVMNETGEIVLDSGEVASSSTTVSNRWTVSQALPTGQKLQVQVRVKDGHAWSAWSEAKWLEVNSAAQVKSVIDGEESHTVYAKSDGSVWNWGYNGNGQLGDGTTTNQTGAIQVPGISQIVDVATGGSHTLALKSDGTVWGWGHKDNRSPVQLAKEAVDIEAYRDTNYITKQDGTLWISKTSNAQSLAKKSGIDGVVQVSAGDYGVFALKSDGSVWNVNSSTSTQISGVEGIVSMASGSSHAIALKSDGTVWGWGYNSYGQLGDGTSTTRSTPIQIPGLSGIVEISSGYSHNLALKADGSVWSWGNNSYGQLGTGNTTSMNKAVQVPGIGKGVTIGAGQYYSEVVQEDGTVWSFGRNNSGQLGNGTVTDSWVPVQMKENTAPVVSLNYPLGTQSSPSVAKVTQPSVEWKQADLEASTVFSHYQVQVMNETGEIVVDSGEVASNGTTATNRWTMSKALPVGQKLQVQVRVKDGHTWSAWSEAKWLEVNGIAKIKAVIDGEENHTVYAKADGSVWTWGYNGNGQLGDVSITSQTGAVQVPGMSEVVDVAAGGNHTLALMSDGTVWGWGHKDNNQAGSPPAKSPIQLAKEALDIEAYGDTNYITKQDGTLWISKTSNAQSLEKKNGIDGIVQVSAGGYGVFALKSDGSVWDMSYSPPKQISGVEGIVAVASGYKHAIALKSDGTVWSWGYNSYGQLGDGTSTTRSTPIQIPGLSDIVEISSGYSHNLALKVDGSVWGWGDNSYGQLGTGNTTSMNKAVQVSRISNGVTIGAGQYYSEVVQEDGNVWSFGRNNSGQLGNGTVTDSWVPVQMKENTAPMVSLNYPMGTQTSPSVAKVTQPSVGWKQTDLEIGTVFSHYQVQVLNENGEVLVDSGEVASNSNTVSNRWTVSQALPTGQKLQVQVRVKDGHAWSAWSEAKWLEVNSAAQVKSVIDGEESHTVYAKSDGSVWSWGYNGNGQLGDGTTTNQTGAIQVPGISQIVDVATGGSHTLALKSDGTVWGWGHKGNKSPVQLAKEAVDIEAYGDTNYITKQDGTLWISKTSNAQSLAKKSGIDGVVQVSAGGYGIFALKSDGSVWDMSYSPPKQISGMEGIVAVVSGYNHAIALKSDGTVWGWGYNNSYQLGDGTTTTRSAPIQIPGLSGIVEISSGYSHNLALKADGSVWSWGNNSYGQLGTGNTTSMSKAVQVPGISKGATIAAGLYYSEVVQEDGTVWSFGRNNYGQLGNGTVTDSLVPVQVKFMP
ncbi:OmpL47-type beta-barrel domain-containing protein [Paenibacillus enshidis]|uniref:OmpL47-type beta-barrel domain-containing protein n=1 Tax=Paenibacillus enshidis TaxID=1458439 RepID=A0ABV5AZM7_9BACL